MSHLIHRTFNSELPFAVKGEGCYLFDEHGKPYLDACGGAAVSCLGHSQQSIIAAINQQQEQLPYAHTSFFTTLGTEQLAENLVKLAPGMNRVMFLSGGSEATEAALKLSRQHFVEAGQPERQYFIARKQSYHGNTLGALAVGGNFWRRKMFEPILTQGQFVSPCYAYRLREADEDGKTFGLRMANELESKILELGPEKVAGFVAETVVGATLGAVTAAEGYFKRIREICDQYGVHLILDEVMCGSGRTGTFLAYEQEAIVPDIVTLAKGLAAGYQPIGAVLCKEEVLEPMIKGSGYFQHGHTFIGHVSAAAAAQETLNIIKRDKLLKNVSLRGDSLLAEFKKVFRDHPHIGNVRGRGLFIGLEFVKDRLSKTPFHPDELIHKKIKQAAMHNGLLCYAMGGTVDGQYGDHVLIAPPYILSQPQEAELVEKLRLSVNRVFT